MLNSLNHLRTLAESAADGMLNSLFAGVGIALLAWAVTCLVRRRGSGTRFAVWFSALIAVAIVPWVSHFDSRQAQTVSGVSHSAVTLPASFATYLFLTWISFGAFGLFRVGFSLYRLRRLRSTCVRVDLSQLGSTMQAAFAGVQVHRRITLCSSDTIRVPAAMGYFRPLVVVPNWAVKEIPASELEAILLHELAHLRRWDDWSNLIQKIVKAIFFFHPAVWFIEDRLSLEREMACDDAVLAADFSPRAYAESLLGLAEKSFLRRGVQLTQAAVGHMQQLRTRIVEILRQDRERSGGVWKPAVAMMAVAGILGGYGVSLGPRLFAFSGGGSLSVTTVASARSNPVLTDIRLRPVSVNLVEDVWRGEVVRHRSSKTISPMIRPVATKPRFARAPRLVQARLFDDEMAPPTMMVLSNLPTPPNVMPPALLVIVQGEQFDMRGPVFWRLTVIRLTQEQERVIAGGVPRMI